MGKTVYSKSVVNADKKTKKAMLKPKGQVDDNERRLIQNMRKAGLSFEDIQTIAVRSSETIAKALGTPIGSKPPARPHKSLKITDSVYSKLESTLEKLLKRAKGEKEVTVDMVKTAAGVDASNQCVLRSFHTHGIYFRKLKEKPVLEEKDVEQRFSWAKDHDKRTAGQWVFKPHAIIDNKWFQIYTNKTGRAHAARRSVRGAYQKKVVHQSRTL